MSTLISKLPLGKLNGGAQDNVEIVIARDVLRLEAEIGQPKNTLNISGFVARVNEEHALVSTEELPLFAANVERAYTYVSEQTPLAISQAGYASYASDEAVKAVRKAVHRIGSAAKDAISKQRPV